MVAAWGAIYDIGVWVVQLTAQPVHPDFRIFYVAAEAGLRHGWSSIYDLPTLRALSAAFPPHRRAWALGIFSSVTGIAVLAGPVVGGAVTQGLAWPWIFWLNVPIGAVMIPLILTRMTATAGTRANLDPVGLILATGGALGLVWALVRANSIGWASPQTVTTLAVGALLAVVFVAWELRTATSLAPPTTATSKRSSIIPWWPVTRWPAHTTACKRGAAWETASCTPFCGKGKSTRRRA